MLDRVVELLSREYEVVGAVCDGQTLLEAAAATNPDVIVSDVSMPIVNGIEAAQQLRKRGSKAKIICSVQISYLGFIRAARSHVIKPQTSIRIKARSKRYCAFAVKVIVKLSRDWTDRLIIDDLFAYSGRMAHDLVGA